jgi:hypothetical protein
MRRLALALGLAAAVGLGPALAHAPGKQVTHAVTEDLGTA